MPLPNNYFATRTKPYAVIESDLDSINNYLNQIADEVRPVSRGGTGISAFTIGDILYASATTTLSVIALATDGYYLTSNGTIPQYRQIVQNEISGLGDTETPTFDEVTTTTKVKTDTIEELTPAAGVTVDGIILKDGGATMAAPIIMAGFKITGLGAPNIATDAATKEYSDALLRVYDWTKSVKDILDLTTSEPGSPSTGDRYLNSATGNTNVTVQAVVIHRIYEWNGVNWTEIIPNEGFTTWVEDENKYYTYYTGVNWVQFGTTISHTVLTGIGTNTHDQIDAVIATIGLNTAGDIITTDAVQTMTNKTLTAPIIVNLALTNPEINEAVEMTATSTELNQLDDVSVGGNTPGDIITTDAIQTLSDKTLSSPIIGNFTNATHNHSGASSGGAAISYDMVLNLYPYIINLTDVTIIEDEFLTFVVSSLGTKTCNAAIPFSKELTTITFEYYMTGSATVDVTVATERKSIIAGSSWSVQDTNTDNHTGFGLKSTAITISALSSNFVYRLVLTATELSGGSNTVRFGSLIMS